MKRFSLILSLSIAFLLTNQQSSAQFYYKDLIIHQKNLQQYQLHKNNRIQSISINSFEDSGDKSEGFMFNQQYNASWSQLKTIAEVENSGRNVVINFYNSQGLFIEQQIAVTEIIPFMNMVMIPCQDWYKFRITRWPLQTRTDRQKCITGFTTCRET